MEHRFKRVFAFLLSMLMLFNSVPINAFAAEGDPADPYAVEGVAEHTHSPAYVEAKDPSCTESGNIAYFYCDCGTYFSDQEATSVISAESVVIAAAGHSRGEGVVTAEATETAEGVMTYTCGCGETRTEAIPMVVPAHTHEWGEGVVTTEATETAEGVMTYTCGCGETRTEVIPMVVPPIRTA